MGLLWCIGGVHRILVTISCAVCGTVEVLAWIRDRELLLVLGLLYRYAHCGRSLIKRRGSLYEQHLPYLEHCDFLLNFVQLLMENSD